MASLAEHVNSVPHKDIYVDECGGECCLRYPGNILDLSSMMAYARRDKGFYDLLRHHIEGIILALPSETEKSVGYRVDLITGKAPSLLLGEFMMLQMELHEQQEIKRCLFYDNGCAIYEQRPEVCMRMVCPLLEEVLKAGT